MFKKLFIFFTVFGFAFLTGFSESFFHSLFFDKEPSVQFQLGFSAQGFGDQGSSDQGQGGQSLSPQREAKKVGDDGKKLNFMGLAMGAMFASQCSKINPFACVAAGLSFLDALVAKNASNSGYTTCASFGNCSDGPSGSPGGNGGDPTGTDFATSQQQERDILTALSGSGFEVNEEDGSVTGPNGKRYTSKDMSSPASMMAMGATAGQAEQFMKSLGDARSKALKKWKEKHGEEAQERGIASIPVSGGSGFGGSGGGRYGQGLSGSGDVIVEEEVHLGKKKGDKLSGEDLTKYSKNFKGQPVGVAMSNLFQIVHKKYKEKRETRKEFINREFVKKKFVRPKKKKLGYLPE